jgi:hypothetical protein
MKRMTKLVAISAAIGLAIPFMGGLLLWNAERAPLLSLDQALWVIDADGFKHSPTSRVGRAMMASLGAAGVDIKEKKWETELFVNLSDDPDIIRKTLSGQTRQRE